MCDVEEGWAKEEEDEEGEDRGEEDGFGGEDEDMSKANVSISFFETGRLRESSGSD